VVRTISSTRKTTLTCETTLGLSTESHIINLASALFVPNSGRVFHTIDDRLCVSQPSMDVICVPIQSPSRPCHEHSLEGLEEAYLKVIRPVASAAESGGGRWRSLSFSAWTVRWDRMHHAFTSRPTFSLHRRRGVCNRKAISKRSACQRGGSQSSTAP